MSLFQRAHDIVSAKANKALDSAENPNEMLDYSYEQMPDQITRVRQAPVDIATSRKRIELQEQQLQHMVAHLQEQAQGALGQSREDLAREALSRKAAAQQQIDAMASQHQELTGRIGGRSGLGTGRDEDPARHRASRTRACRRQLVTAPRCSKDDEPCSRMRPL